MGILDFFKKSTRQLKEEKSSETNEPLQLPSITTQTIADPVAETVNVDSLISKLTSVDWHVRKNAAEALGEKGDSRAVKPLITALNDGVDSVRKSAAEAIMKIGEPAVASLLSALNGDDINVAKAAEMLGQIGNASAIEPLLLQLRNKLSHKVYEDYNKVHDLYIRPINVAEHICVALKKMDKLVLAVEPLIMALKDNNNNLEVRESVCKELKKIGEPAVKALISTLRDTNCQVRGSIAEILGEICHIEGTMPLIEALKDKDPSIRLSSANALGKIGDKRAIQPLVQAMEEGDSFVRKSVGEALVKLGWQPLNLMEKATYYLSLQHWDEVTKIGKPVVELLISSLMDKDYRVRECAAKSLGEIGDKRAVEPLINALNDVAMVRAKAAEALGQIGDVRAVEPLITVLKSGCVQAAKVLGSLGDVRAVEPLITALRDGEYFTRFEAATSLGAIGDARAVETLKAALNDKDFRVREQATLSLRKIGEPAVVTLIAAIRADPDDQTQNETYRNVLRQISDPKAVDHFTSVLKNKDWSRWCWKDQECAVEALGEIGDVRAIGPLDEAINSSHTFYTVKERAEASKQKIQESLKPRRGL